jgi:hypothetical protein
VQVADHDLGIDEVLGATEGNQTDFNHAKNARGQQGARVGGKSKNGPDIRSRRTL